MTTKQDIRQYLDYGKSVGATHCIIVCDEFDYVDYPVLVTPNQDVKERVHHYETAPLTSVMEVYNLSLPFEEQIAKVVAWNL